MTQYDHESTAGGYASSSAGPLHFGLGAHASADVVEIHWPSSIIQKLTNVAGDRILTVQEPPDRRPRTTSRRAVGRKYLRRLGSALAPGDER
jgi:hypothetical protein